MAEAFPDLNKDGEVTQADVLMGRGAFAEGSQTNQKYKKITIKDEDGDDKFFLVPKDTNLNKTTIVQEKNRDDFNDKYKQIKFKDKDGKDKFYYVPRDMFNVGGETSLMVPPEMEMPAEEPPVDTYDNISPEEEMQQAEDMLPDDEMEEEYVDYVAEEVLEPEEQEYLFKVLDEDPRLEGILDKIILNATEFAGAGEVEGPGTGISDSIPARLSDGEFVITKKATDQIGADNLQKMMDDAERAYDGGLMGYANGGEAGTNPFVNPEEMYGVPKDGEEDIQRQMLYSSRMPSLMNR